MMLLHQAQLIHIRVLGGIHMNYNEFINSIKESRKNEWFEYSERHHIIPRCIGGKDDSDNLIHLTYGEHFIAHKLLAEENPNDHKLALAYDYMTKTRKGIATPEDYSLAKRLAHDARVELYSQNLGKIWEDPEFVERKKENSRETMLRNHQNPEFSSALSERGKVQMSIINSDPEIKRLNLERLINYNEEHKEAHRAFMRAYNEEHKNDQKRIERQKIQGAKTFKEYNERTGSLPIFKKICKTCHREFLGKKAQQYCCDGCMPARYHPEILVRVCPTCSKEFETSYKRKRFCSVECRDRRR